MMKSKFFVLSCIIIISMVLMLSGCVTSLNSGNARVRKEWDSPFIYSCKNK